LAAKKLRRRKVEKLEVTAAPGFALKGIAMLNARGFPSEDVRGDHRFSIVMDCDIPLDFGEGMLEVVIASEEGDLVVETRRAVEIEGAPTYRRIEIIFPSGAPL